MKQQQHQHQDGAGKRETIAEADDECCSSKQRQHPEQAASRPKAIESASWMSNSELIFSLTNQVGGLVRALRIFEELKIGIKHIESRKSKRRDSEFEIFVDIDCDDQDKMRKLAHSLR